MLRRNLPLYLVLFIAAGFPGCRMRQVPIYPSASKSYIYPKLEVATLTGAIRIEGHPAMLKDVRIEALAISGEVPVVVAKSNSRGEFRLKLPKGDYLLRFSLRGFDTVVLPVAYTGAGVPTILIALPPST